MSGTGYGTVVLHVAPEAAVGGPLALVRDGDVVVLDVPNRTLDLDVDDAELTRRRTAWKATAERHTSGYAWLYTQNVEQADRGADFAFLRGSRGHEVPRDSH
jgi:dihydroxy-acid dehydratase